MRCIVGDIAWLRENHPQWLGLTGIALIEAAREEAGKPASRQTPSTSALSRPALPIKEASASNWALPRKDTLAPGALDARAALL